MAELIVSEAQLNCLKAAVNRLLSVAQRSCPDVVPEIRAAIEQAPT